MDELEILSECVIKIENVKQETADHAEEEAFNFMEGDGTFPLKSEVKEEVEEEGDWTYPLRSDVTEEEDEEEIKPPIEVFLDPEEVLIGDVKQEQKDPLAMCNENLFGESPLSVGGEYEATGDLLGSKKEVRNPDCGTASCNDANSKSLGKRRVRKSEILLRNDLLQNDPQFPKTISAKHVDEHSVRVTSSSESGCEVGIERKEEGDNDPESLKRRHVRIRSINRTHQCSHCQRNFTRKRNLVPHMRAHSGDRPHKCPVCQKSFTQNSHLVSHMRIHSGERPHKCSVCQKSFTVSSNLVTHMRIHSGERPHKCSVCEKSFRVSSHLVSHMRIHSGERPHKCSVCQKTFTESSHLVRHMRIHSGERPHKCSVCQKSFTESSNLVRHMRIHSGERPHKCSVCQKSFRVSSNLVTHMRIQSGERPHIGLCAKGDSHTPQLLLITCGSAGFNAIK